MDSQQKDNTFRLVYAENSNHELVSIDEVPNGKKCNCICPFCKSPLMAKQGPKRVHHFAHINAQKKEIEGCGIKGIMSTIHWLAQEIILEEKAVMVPEYHKVSPAHKVTFMDDLQSEKTFGDNVLRFDIYGETNEKFSLGVEIYYAHKVDDDKRRKIIENGLCCIEIDVNYVPKSNDPVKLKENIRDFLLDSPKHREWINNPFYEEKRPQTPVETQSSKSPSHIVKKHIPSLNQDFVTSPPPPFPPKPTKLPSPTKSISSSPSTPPTKQPSPINLSSGNNNAKPLRNNHHEAASRKIDPIPEVEELYQKLYNDFKNRRYFENPYIKKSYIVDLKISSNGKEIVVLHIDEDLKQPNPVYVTKIVFINNEKKYYSSGPFPTEDAGFWAMKRKSL